MLTYVAIGIAVLAAIYFLFLRGKPEAPQVKAADEAKIMREAVSLLSFAGFHRERYVKPGFVARSCRNESRRRIPTNSCRPRPTMLNC